VKGSTTAAASAAQAIPKSQGWAKRLVDIKSDSNWVNRRF